MNLRARIAHFKAREDSERKYPRSDLSHMATPEGEIVRQILDYPEAKRIFHSRQNTVEKAARGRYIHAHKGVPDIFAMKDGKLYGIEVKTPTVRVSPEQAQFGVDCVKNGGEYLVARSIDELKAVGL